MRSTRPKRTHQLSIGQASRLRRKWREWLDVIAQDAADQMIGFEVYKELRGIVAANARIQHPSYFHEWIGNNFAAASTVRLRRFDDKDPRSQSLWRILYEMLEYPGVVTRRSHKAVYTVDRHLADVSFDNAVGEGRDCLGPSRVRKDLRRIEGSCARIRRFVNKRVAHVGKKGALRKNPTFGELEAALSEVDSVVCYYQLLLTGTAPSTQKPTLQFDWEDVLREPWLPRPNERERPEDRQSGQEQV